MARPAARVTRLAAFSDVHGELQPLLCVWRDIEERGLAGGPVVLNAGDTVAYGRETMACIDFVRDPARKILSVLGNYDANAARFPDKEDDYRRKWHGRRPEKFDALKQASADLRGDAREWLAALPKAQVVAAAGQSISLSHYAPGTDKEGLFPTTPLSRLMEIAASVRAAASVVVVGHTHAPFVRRAGGVLFVNPGSVGRRSGTVATYAEIALGEGRAPDARIITCRISQQ